MGPLRAFCGRTANRLQLGIKQIPQPPDIVDCKKCLSKHRKMVNATTTNSVAPSTAAPEHPPIIDLSNFEERRDEIVKELMEAATTVG